MTPWVFTSGGRAKMQTQREGSLGAEGRSGTACWLTKIYAQGLYFICTKKNVHVVFLIWVSPNESYSNRAMAAELWQQSSHARHTLSISDKITAELTVVGTACGLWTPPIIFALSSQVSPAAPMAACGLRTPPIIFTPSSQVSPAAPMAACGLWTPPIIFARAAKSRLLLLWQYVACGRRILSSPRAAKSRQLLLREHVACGRRLLSSPRAAKSRQLLLRQHVTCGRLLSSPRAAKSEQLLLASCALSPTRAALGLRSPLGEELVAPWVHGKSMRLLVGNSLLLGVGNLLRLLVGNSLPLRVGNQLRLGVGNSSRLWWELAAPWGGEREESRARGSLVEYSIQLNDEDRGFNSVDTVNY